MTTDPTTTSGAAAPCASCGEPPTPAAAEQAAEPLTHCEWCGAEYPTPADG